MLEKKTLIQISLILLVIFNISSKVQGQTKKVKPRNDLLEPASFIHINGPNPILVPGEAGEWDDGILETAGVFKDFGIYYLYYHAEGGGKGYQVGVATSDNPLGPFKRYEKNPILEIGPEGGAEDIHVACALIIKEGVDKYYMWYCAKSQKENINTKQFESIWGIHLATASHPLGPWKKYEGNPLMKDFGYVSAVVKYQGKYYMYSAYPIGVIGPDYSPMSLATADKPEGPWERYPGNPIFKKGDWGEWDDGGFSDAAVVYTAGVFHMFYSGAKLYSPRILTRESVGYAYSYDGINFSKYGRNPIVPREACPYIASLSEPRVIWEPPFVYVYSTLRYTEAWREIDKEQFPRVEDLGVQVLVMQRPFSLAVPVLKLDALGPGEQTQLLECPAVDLRHVGRSALTMEGMYGAKAKASLRLHVRGSSDGIEFDTEDIVTLEGDLTAGKLYRETFDIDTNTAFIKVIVENPDNSEAVTAIKVTSTLKD